MRIQLIFERHRDRSLVGLHSACFDDDDAHQVARALSVAWFRARPADFARIHEPMLKDLGFMFPRGLADMTDDEVSDLCTREDTAPFVAQAHDLEEIVVLEDLGPAERAGARAARALTAYVVMRKSWDCQDDGYDFRGNVGIEHVCFTRARVDARLRADTARFVRETFWQLDRYRGGAARPALDEDAVDALTDDEALAIAAACQLPSPFSVQEIVVTPDFLHVARLSGGKRAALLRAFDG